MTLPLALYGLATGLAEPLAPFILKRRAKVGREDPLRLDERLGRTRSPRPPGPLVWLHGVSVGETVSLLPLVEGLRARRPDLGLLVTSGTRASAELLGRRLPAGVRSDPDRRRPPVQVGSRLDAARCCAGRAPARIGAPPRINPLASLFQANRGAGRCN